ncbi:MAG TPA: tetratricopeptide repeat protein, partial [Ignavibacteria bacterium]|nr:tetratricopeptide repeat protein [Ignavibacteria bacterium]
LLADIYSSAHELDSAAVVLKNVIKLDSTDINAYYILARIYELSKPMEAINIYNRLTSIIGPDWNVLIHVTNLYVKLGKYAEAAGTINKLLTISPSNTSLEKLQADYYGRAKMYKKALFAINDVLEFLPNDLDAHQRKAEIFIAQDKWKKAAKEYSFIIKQNNVSFRTKLQIGASYFNQALKDSTLFPIVHKFFKTIEKDTSSWQTKMYLGAIAIAQKNDSIAVKDFKIALKLAKWNVEPWVRLGGLYFDNHKYNAAIKLLKGAFKSFPEDFRVNLILGLSLAQKGNNKDARKYLKRAVEVNPKDITALSAYGYTLSRLKENEEAIKYLKKALVISPNNINLLSTLGLIYDSESKWALCDSVYQKALSIDPTNALVLNNYAYSLSERGIKLDSALNMAKKAIKAEPKNSSYLDTVGWIYYRLKEYQNAKEYVQKAVQIGGHDSVMLEHLGDINYKLGQKEKALNLWKKAFKMDTTNKKLKLKIEKGKI